MSKRKPHPVANSRLSGPIPVKGSGSGTPRGTRGRRNLMLLVVGMVLGGLAAVLLVQRPARKEAVRSEATPAPVFPLAEQPLRDALARLPGDAGAHRALGRYLLDQRRPFEALWHFRTARELRPTDQDLEVSIARAFTQAGIPDRAASMLRARLAGSSGVLDARIGLAESALAIGRPEEAVSVLTAAGAAIAASAPAQLLLGDARATTGDTAGARAAYRRVTALEPEGAVGYDRLGRLALAAEDWAAAKSAFTAARERAPDVPGHGFRLGEAYAGEGNHEAAEQLWQSVAESASEYVPARVALGKAHRRRKEWDAAARHLVEAVRADPASREAQFALAEVMTAEGDRASAFHQRGVYYLQTDRPHRALAESRRMAAVAPDGADGPLLAGLAYIRMQRLDRAAVVTERALKKRPHDARFLARLGLLHVLGRNRPLARQVCEEWLKVDPKAAEPYRLLGRIEREERRLPESLQYYEQALARDPENATICLEMSRTLAGLPGAENARRALELAGKAAELNPREAEHWHHLGTLLRAAGRVEEAVSAFLHSLDLDPGSVASGQALVQITAQAGRPEAVRFYAGIVSELEQRRRDSRGLWRAVFTRPADPAAHERLARFLMTTGDLRRAAYQLEQVVELRPGDGRPRRELEGIERVLGLREDP